MRPVFGQPLTALEVRRVLEQERRAGIEMMLLARVGGYDARIVIVDEVVRAASKEYGRKVFRKEVESAFEALVGSGRLRWSRTRMWQAPSEATRDVETSEAPDTVPAGTTKSHRRQRSEVAGARRAGESRNG